MTVDLGILELSARVAGEHESLGFFAPCPDRRGAIVARVGGLCNEADPDLLKHLSVCIACAAALEGLERKVRGGSEGANELPPTNDAEPASTVPRPPASSEAWPRPADPPLVGPNLGGLDGTRTDGGARRGRNAAGAALHGLVVILICGLAVIVAVIVGSALLESGGSAHSLRTAQRGLLSLSYESPWLPAPETVPDAFALRSAIVLSRPGVTLTAGTLTRSAPIPGGPPPDLVGRFGDPVAARVTTVAGHPGVRYRWALSGGRRVVAFVIPTAFADLALVCSGSDSALGPCGALSVSAKVYGAQVLPPGPNASLATALKVNLTEVASARLRLSTPFANQLSLGVVRTRAKAVAEMEQRQARALGSLAAPARNMRAVAGIAQAVGAEGVAFSELAGAARAGNESAYRRAAAGVTTASAAVSAAAKSLWDQGFVLPALPLLRLAPLAAAPPRRPAPHRRVSSSAPSLASPSPPVASLPPTSSPPPTSSSPPLSPVLPPPPSFSPLPWHQPPPPVHHSHPTTTVVARPLT